MESSNSGLVSANIEALRARTRDLHTRAERSGIVGALLRGVVSPDAYCLYLRNLHPVYSGIEAELERRRGSADVGLIAQPALYRSRALCADLDSLYGANWRDALPVLPATRRYTERIAAVAGSDRVRLVAHAYVRYLGDLSGGRILKRLLNQKIGLKSSDLAFYEFPDIADLENFKSNYLACIAGIMSDAAASCSILDEAEAAFALNIDLSEAVQAAAEAHRIG